MPIIGHLGAAASGLYKYFIEKSVRFRSSVNAYLTRTTTQGSTTTMTWSFWYKPSLYANKTLFGCSLSGSQIEGIGFDMGFGYGSERLHFVSAQGGFIFNILTKRRFRDPTSWYHFVVVLDTTQAVSTDRVRIYVNGTRETEFDVASFPAQNANMWYMNGVYQNYINQLGPNYMSYQSDGHLAEVHMLDGYAYGPENFGESVNGTWIPKKYTGAYGANGYYLDFKTGTNLTTLFQDKSGNAKHWTSTNVSLTAGQTYDWSNDTPTSNYCTANPLDVLSTTATSSDGALQSTSGAGGYLGKRGTFAVSAGKWYWEVTPTAGTEWYIGVSRAESTADGIIGNTSGGQQTGYAYGYAGQKLSGTIASYGATYTINDVIGIALNLDAGTIEFFKNGVSQGVAFASGVSGNFFPAFSDGSGAASASVVYNFGQRPFAYTPPSGFKSLSTSNLPEPGYAASDPSKHFNVLLWTGDNATSRSITGAAFTPDLVWGKTRSQVRQHTLFDSVRGAGSNKVLISSATDAEGGAAGNESSVYGYVSAFNSNGFSVSNGSTNGAYWNASATNYAAWLWKAGGAAVTNNAGSIASQVSVNAAAGFSIVTWTGNGLAGATVGHGLPVKPELIITKSRSDAVAWWVTHPGIPNAWAQLNSTIAATAGGGAGGAPGYYSTNTATTFGFTAGSSNVDNVNRNGGTYVAYCFNSIPGYSKVGYYTGNGSTDGTFVECGFRPRFVLVKCSSGAGSWYIFDTARDPINATNYGLFPDLASGEQTGVVCDVVANGFKLRNALAGMNQNTASYIFVAFAEAPFKYANAR